MHGTGFTPHPHPGHGPPAVIYEHRDFLIVNKPPGQPTHPSKPNHGHTLWHDLRHLLAFELVNSGQISIITRLDRETSGLVLAAKNKVGARHLGKLMERHRIEKTYQALVHGWPDWETDECHGPIIRQGEIGPSKIWLKRVVHPSGVPAHTHFRVLTKWRDAQDQKFSLLEARPVTGRTHQIRVHLAHLGWPIVGDKIYGPDEACYLEFIETGWSPRLQRLLRLPRHALHASRLQIKDLKVDVHAPASRDLLDFIQTA